MSKIKPSVVHWPMEKDPLIFSMGQRVIDVTISLFVLKISCHLSYLAIIKLPDITDF